MMSIRAGVIRSAMAVSTRRLSIPITQTARVTSANRLYQGYSKQCYTTSTVALSSSSELSKYYHVEVSNADRPDATRITVRGPDVDGILASMTVALAQEGCSLKELHAGYAKTETVSYEQKGRKDDQIEDIFYVAQHSTGEPFPDDALQDLGLSLLASLRTPMVCLSGKQTQVDLKQEHHQEHDHENDQITIVKSK
ncbi:expressed unknown protein [Seminavis robusta]|uniref:ACT domain-containing protein n=1 Tax=Seminavis robusta TaxID=568900 RepID=A0A9N8HUT0_9STRA|nr:expressed unknown protein [Seminavis robusta]|eukprot:Sro1693_g291680.1 n/a (196) ;mRNA; f:19415-20002